MVLHRYPRASHWLMAGPDPGTAAGWPALFRPVDAQDGWTRPGRAALQAGQVTLLGTTRTLARPAGPGPACWDDADWASDGEPLLWRFHLYYWDWAWGLTRGPDRAGARTLFARMWRSWSQAVPAGRGVPWHPYPAALRAWSFCGLYRDLVAGSDIEGPFLADLAAHAGFLRHHLERDVGGNHLIKNIKALAGLAVFFADRTLLGWAEEQLRRQLEVQVLPDGGHYERAPAYHCQVLADLIDMHALILAAGQAPATGLPMTILRMRRWLGAVLIPGGEVPLLNDGFPVGAALLKAIQPLPPPPGPLVMLPESGLVRATAGAWHLLADVGLPCPDELPAHAHADTLGCVVHVDGQPLLVDTGTSTYARGPRRSLERSTAAHNTVEVDGTDSTEVWGAFRAARRARVRNVRASATPSVTIEAAHDGYRALRGRPSHHRRWSLTEGALRIDDTVTGEGRHRVVLRWHLPAGAGLRLVPGGAVAATPAGDFRVAVTASSPPILTAEAAELATGFGRRVTAPVLRCGLDTALPVQISTSWQRSGDWQGA